MKLYYFPGACSLAPHIVLHEAGIPADIERVDLASKKTASGRDFKTINPKGYVPALELDNGTVLTEVPAILQYLADQRPEKQLAPPATSFSRYQLQEWLNFITAEVHKTYSPLFGPEVPGQTRERVLQLLNQRYDYVEQRLADRPFLTGEQFTIADAYLFTINNWAGYLKLDVVRNRSNITAFMKRVAARAGVQAALKAEGLTE